VPSPPDWPDSVQTSGFWFLERPGDWSPPDDLLSFLAAGPPPVYVGFGSMASSQSKKITNIVVSALSKSGVRGIIATGWGGLDADHYADTIFRTDSVPHDWLFPRVSAVVHHGGAGTTAAGLRAGRPTLVCPIFGDQPFWGKVVHDLGAGAKPIYQKKLTVDNLHEAITQLLNTASIKEKATELGVKIRNEDGIGAAIAVIESEQRVQGD
jgi:sterol 3beta-glucosyltransferase